MIENPKIASLNILLADDDNDDRFFFSKALEEISIATNINTVNDGEQLMDYLVFNSDHLPDILFLDLNMPRKNGFECLLELMGNAKFKSIYVIMFSTSYPRDQNYEVDMIKRLYKMGAQDYIRKPGDFAQLKLVIQIAITKAIETKFKNVLDKITVIKTPAEN